MEGLETESARLTSSKQLEAQFPSATIESDMASLREEWTALLAESSSRGAKLNDVIAEHSFYQKTDDLLSWIAKAEASLSSPATGEDLPTAKLLLKQHEHLIADIVTHATTLAELIVAADAIVTSENFHAEEVRYHSRVGIATQTPNSRATVTFLCVGN